MSESSPLTRPPIFVVGVGRSGTSLLHSMLHAHPAVVMLPETHFFRKYVAHPIPHWRHKNAGTEAFCATLAADDDYQRAGVSPDDVLQPFLKGGRSFDLVEVYTRLLQLYREREGVQRVGEKDPRLIDALPRLKQAFPDARVLHIVRDPRDVLLSRMNACWSGNRPDWLHSLTYRAQLVRGRSEGRRSFGENYMEVQYERLLSEPEETLKAVAEHIDVDYTDAMLSFQKPAETLVDENERDWKAETTGPLLRDNTGKWQGRLSDWQIRFTEYVCAPAFDWFDYAPDDTQSALSLPQRVALWGAPILGKGFEYAYSVARHIR